MLPKAIHSSSLWNDTSSSSASLYHLLPLCDDLTYYFKKSTEPSEEDLCVFLAGIYHNPSTFVPLDSSAILPADTSAACWAARPLSPAPPWTSSKMKLWLSSLLHPVSISLIPLTQSHQHTNTLYPLPYLKESPQITCPLQLLPILLLLWIERVFWKLESVVHVLWLCTQVLFSPQPTQSRLLLPSFHWNFSS